MGVSRDALLGRYLLDLHPADLRGRVEAILRSPGDSPAARAVTVTLPERTLVLKIEPLSGDGRITLIVQDPADLTLEAPRPVAPAGARARPRIPVDAADGVDLLDPARAIYARAAGHYSQVRLAEGERFCSLSLKALEDRLGEQGFVRVHRGWLVNLSRVRALRRKGEATVLDMDVEPGAAVPVSRGQVARVRALLAL